MKKLQRIATSAAIGCLISGCTSGNAGVTVPFTSQPLAGTRTLEFAVGTANLGYSLDGTTVSHVVGLNTVVSFRRNDNGQDGSLLDTPAITGPPTFSIPAADALLGAKGDAGTSHITGSSPVIPGQVAAPTTFGSSGGAFSYGFLPDNSTTSGALQSHFFAQPFYADPTSTTGYNNSFDFIGGPPLFPSPSTQAPGFNGYPQGFTTFDVPPGTGTYALAVTIPSANTSQTTTFSASATLQNATPLPQFGIPNFVEDASMDGGGTLSVSVPAGFTEVVAYFVDANTGASFTVPVPATSGTQIVNLGASLGGGGAPTFAAGDPYEIEVVGFDYPAMEAVATAAKSTVNPTITGANGQADLTISVPFFSSENGYGASTNRRVAERRLDSRRFATLFARLRQH